MHSDLIQAAGRVRSFMRQSLAHGEHEQDFNQLALDLFALQLQENAGYRKLCEARKLTRAHNWHEIPAVPTFAFKQLELTSLPPAERSNVFYSSGTTQQDRSRHFHSHASLALYEDSLWAWFERFFPRQLRGATFLFLTPNAQQAPNSSLAHMFTAIATRMNAPANFVGTIGTGGTWHLDWPKMKPTLENAVRQNKPVAIFGTAFLFVHLLDELEDSQTNIRLPENSWILETGGYKGRSREVPKEELHQLFIKRLAISRENIFGEYGMSELSSQAYADSEGLFQFPPWVRTQIISPATGREAKEGEPGLIRVYDLANIWSVMSVQTEDVGIKVGDAFRLVGRAAQAEARGCSLMSV